VELTITTARCTAPGQMPGRLLLRLRTALLQGLLPALVAGVLSACASTAAPLDQAAHSASPDNIALLLEARIAVLAGGEPLLVRDVPLNESDTLAEFYTRRAFRPAWGDATTREALLRAIRASEMEGLDPRDYQLEQLEALQVELAGRSPGVFAQADAELLCSHALARLARHYARGKVDPALTQPSWNGVAHDAGPDAATRLAEMIGPDLGVQLAAELPPHPLYRMLRNELHRLREIAAQGGWPALPAGPTLKPGMQDARIPLLRERLLRSGDLPQAAFDAFAGEDYDSELQAAVQRFQARHGLTDDGAIGRDTLEQLNTPVEARIATVRVNLDRARVLLRDLPARFVVVNIAGFHAYLIDEGRIAWDARAVVGQRYRETPLFRSEISWLQWNPSWTVPPGIIEKDILPDARVDPASITRRGLQVLDRDGNEVDPHAIDWSAYRSGHIPWTLRQPPGPNNALGRVKFMFPNSHAVYLHDTPSTNLFDRDQRTFSSGCVRIDDPLTLARLLINDPGWDDARIADTVTGGETVTLVLAQRVPVVLAYWTAWPQPGAGLQLRRDVYRLDARWLAELDPPGPSPRLPPPEATQPQAPPAGPQAAPAALPAGGLAP
jgi:murein L,D-transpeptidase YcbB/YkuD